jgi:hypothetical protein
MTPASFHFACVVLLLSFLHSVAAAGCAHCKDSAGFPDHVTATCPFVVEASSNVAKALAGDKVTLDSSLLPTPLLRMFPPGVLKTIIEKFKTTSHTYVITASSTFTAIMGAVRSSQLSKQDALDHYYQALEGATSGDTIAKVNGYIKALTEASGDGVSGALDGVSMFMSGCYTYMLAIVSKFVMLESTASLALSEGSTSTQVTTTLRATHHRPTRFSEFMEMLHYYMWLVSYAGIVAYPIISRFITRVVWNNLNHRKAVWQVVHELLLVILDNIEQSNGVRHMGNVLDIGSEDTFMAQARIKAEAHYPSIFRTLGGNPGNVTRDAGTSNKVKWNGKDTPTSNKFCYSYNLGTEHPASALHKDGTCKFKHACDHFISGAGPNARCGLLHSRKECDNAHKCDTAEK